MVCQKGVPLHLEHFVKRAKNSGDWPGETITESLFEQLLQNRIESASFDGIKDDIVRFIKDDRDLKIWSPAYFKDLAQRIKFN